MNTIHILMVESDAEYARLAKQTLKGSDLSCAVQITPLLSRALKALKRRRFNIVLLNLDLPDSSGLATLESVISAWPRTPVVAIVGAEYENMKADILNGGATECLIKAALGKQQLVDAVKTLSEGPTIQSPHFEQRPKTRSKRRPKE